MAVNTLIVQPPRRTWEQSPRVCVTCGETHADGQPNPSGRECKRIQTTHYVPVYTRPARIEKTAAHRTCNICNVQKHANQFSGAHSFRCLPCVEVRRVGVGARQKDNRKAWRERNVEHVRALEAAANRRCRAKKKLKEGK